jgi:hypothetical protein
MSKEQLDQELRELEERLKKANIDLNEHAIQLELF